MRGILWRVNIFEKQIQRMDHSCMLSRKTGSCQGVYQILLETGFQYKHSEVVELDDSTDNW